MSDETKRPSTEESVSPADPSASDAVILAPSADPVGDERPALDPLSAPSSETPAPASEEAPVEVFHETPPENVSAASSEVSGKVLPAALSNAIGGASADGSTASSVGAGTPTPGASLQAAASPAVGRGFAPPPPSIPTAALPDAMVLGRFRTADASGYAQINRDHFLSLSEEALLYLQAHYRDDARREPTLGELRVLDALTRVPTEGAVGHRHAVGEFLTESPTLAETWADMMQKHNALASAAGAGIPPCTYEDALTLIARLLRRTGRREVEPLRPRRDGSPVPVRLLVQTPAQEMEAVAKGFSPRARIQTADGRTVSVFSRVGEPVQPTIPRKGEMLLYAPQVPSEILRAFMEHQGGMPVPDAGEVRVVTRCSILETVAEMTEGAELYAHALLPTSLWPTLRKLPVDRLCGMPEVTAPCADVLIRTPVARVSYLVSDLARRGVSAVVIGQVSADAHIRLRLQNTVPVWHAVVADFRIGLLRAMRTVTAHTCRPALTETASAPVTELAMARLPGVHAAEDGITPTGYEAVALTATPSSVLFVREERMALSQAAVTVNETGTGYTAAIRAVEHALGALSAAVADASDRGEITLSVSLTVKHPKRAPQTAHDRLVEVLCGLYRAAAERGVPVADPALRFVATEDGDASEATSVSLLVWAWVQVSTPLREDDRQWSRFATQAVSPAPTFLFPNLRRSAEGSLHALAAALNRRLDAACVIQPMVIDSTEAVELSSADETPSVVATPIASETPETPTMLDPAPAPENADGDEPQSPSESASVDAAGSPTASPTRISESSAERLVIRAGGDAIPIFAMSAEDAELLLEHAMIRAYVDSRLRVGKTVIAVGDACRAFAAHGYLPETLTEASEIAYEGVARVDYHGLLAGHVPVTRLVRRPLYLPDDGDLPALLTLTLPDGRTVPDGFVGCDGCMLGLMSGVDTVAETILRGSRFAAETPAVESADPVSSKKTHI